MVLAAGCFVVICSAFFLNQPVYRLCSTSILLMALSAPCLIAMLTLANLTKLPSADNTTLFQCKRLFAGTGVIFYQDAGHLFISAQKLTDSITQREAERADSIMLATSGNRDFVKNKRRYYRYDRQYVGYRDEIGHKIVFINLIDKSKARKYLSPYRRALTANLIVVFTEPGDEFSITKKVDMHQNKVIDY
jgi:hypothetical protein